MVDFSQYGTADYANKMADKLSGFNLPENIAARRSVQIGQQEQEMRLRQMQQDVQDKALAQQAWKSAVEQSKVTGESPATIYRKNAANLGYAQATEAEKYDQELKKLNAPKYEFDKTTGQLVGVSPSGEVTVKKAENYTIPTKEVQPTEIERLLLASGFQRGSPEWNQAIGSAVQKATGQGETASDRLARERFEFEKRKAQGEKQIKPSFSAELGGYVYPPDAQNPAGRFVPVEGAKKAGKLTEAQAKATTFASQMAAASNELDKLEAGGYDPSSAYSQFETGMAGGLGNVFASQKAQQAKQTQNQWSEAFLRVKTGAAATLPEVELNNKTFFPQYGDGPDVIEQKRQMRANAEQDVLNMAGEGRGLATQRIQRPDTKTVTGQIKNSNPHASKTDAQIRAELGL